jgi:hypothetical protein
MVIANPLRGGKNNLSVARLHEHSYTLSAWLGSEVSILHIGRVAAVVTHGKLADRLSAEVAMTAITPELLDYFETFVPIVETENIKVRVRPAGHARVRR